MRKTPFDIGCIISQFVRHAIDFDESKSGFHNYGELESRSEVQMKKTTSIGKSP